MPAEPIRFFHRYERTLQTEQVYGEKWLRFAYERPVGRFLVWLLARRAFFSHYYGWQMRKRVSANRILPFIIKYNIDADEFARSAFDFKTFNEFFYRALKPESRPVATEENVAVLPADGRHLVFPNLDLADGFYAKGERFTLADLLQDGTAAEEFSGGGMLISRLCPSDYHRFHFPVSGTPGEVRRIPGWLYSVNPVALRRNIRYLVQNKRQVTRIESPQFGPVMMVEIGATNVGSIQSSFVPGRSTAKGTEKGFFAFGGSCVITLFRARRIRFDDDLVEQSRQCVETYARMGDRLGKAGVGE